MVMNFAPKGTLIDGGPLELKVVHKKPIDAGRDGVPDVDIYELRALCMCGNGLHTTIFKEKNEAPHTVRCPRCNRILTIL